MHVLFDNVLTQHKNIISRYRFYVLIVVTSFPFPTQLRFPLHWEGNGFCKAKFDKKVNYEIIKIIFK